MTDKTGGFRDDLAVKILLAWCGNANSPMRRDRDGHARLWKLETLAEAVYELADAMLKARGDMENKMDIKNIKANVVVDFGDNAYAILMGDKSTCAERAILIATASELLEALIEITESAKEAIDGLGDLSDAIDTAKAAIAKALGQQ